MKSKYIGGNIGFQNIDKNNFLITNSLFNRRMHLSANKNNVQTKITYKQTRGLLETSAGGNERQCQQNNFRSKQFMETSTAL